MLLAKHDYSLYLLPKKKMRIPFDLSFSFFSASILRFEMYFLKPNNYSSKPLKKKRESIEMTPRTDNENIFIPPCRISHSFKEEKKKEEFKIQRERIPF